MTILTPVGEVISPLKDLNNCPPQGREGAPAARIRIFPEFRMAMKGISPGERILVLTWFHLSDRTVLECHPRGNPKNPLTGVFMTRSPNRPNPIGLHEVVVEQVDEAAGELTVFPLEALDHTPVIDLKSSGSRGSTRP